MCDLNREDHSTVTTLIESVTTHARSLATHVQADGYMDHERLLRDLDSLATSVRAAREWVSTRAHHSMT